jgi:hypothetical protein
MPHEAHDISSELLDQLIWRRASIAAQHDKAVELAKIPPELAPEFPRIPARGEVQEALAQIALRRAGDPEADIVLYTLGELGAFIGGVKDGEFDDLGKEY